MASKDRSIDVTAIQMLDKAEQENIQTVWDRHDAMQPQCRFGQSGVCCRFCNMGPCRITKKTSRGVCGANVDTIVARNLALKIAVGAAAHSDHGRDVARTFFEVAEGKAEGYKITNEKKLKRIAEDLEVKVDGRDIKEIAKDVAKIAYAQFGQQEGELAFIKRAPQRRQELWRKLGVVPRGVDREIVETLHRDHIGVDADYKNIIMHGIRTCIADGWGGSMIATDLQDVLFGSPTPIRAQVNLGVLKEDEVNLVVHGHEPILSEMIVIASQDPELIALAKEKGAKGINISGICCTATEILMRHGIPAAGNFLQQELAVVTGAVELILVDVQCIMPSLPEVASFYHTKVVTTSPKGRIPGATHIQFEEEEAIPIAKKIVRQAIENFPNRNKDLVDIPKEKMDLIGGFTVDTVYKFLGGKYRPSYRPLNDGIISGRLRGIAGVVGCNNPKIKHDYAHVAMVKELIKNDVLVVQTGCSAIACAKAGLLRPEAAREYAGRGLREICEAVGIPPVLHVGSCVDNSRILLACCDILKEGGLGEDISDLPVAGAAPEWMSDKAISIGFYVVSSGIFTVFSNPLPILGSSNVTKLICEELEDIIGARYAFEADPIKAAYLMIEHMNKKRAQLKLSPMMYEEEEVKVAAAAM